MRTGYSGNKIAENKQEAIQLLKDSFDGRINLSKFDELEISERTLYNFFDGVEEAEKTVFGEKDNYECEKCETNFTNRSTFIAHESNCSKERQEALHKTKKLLSDYKVGKYTVYVIKLEDSNRETWWYVGESKSVVERICSHIRNGFSQKPQKDFSVKSIQKVENFSSKQAARDRERELSFEICLEKQTTNILGGR